MVNSEQQKEVLIPFSQQEVYIVLLSLMEQREYFQGHHAEGQLILNDMPEGKAKEEMIEGLKVTDYILALNLSLLQKLGTLYEKPEVIESFIKTLKDQKNDEPKQDDNDPKEHP